MKIAGVVISTTEDLYRLKERYQELCEDPGNTDTDIVVGMLVETALIVASKGIGMYIRKLGELIMKGLGKSSKAATITIKGVGSIERSTLDSKIQYQRNK